MEWLQIIIYTTSEGIEPVSGRLYQLGITGIEIEDEKDFKDFLAQNHQYWDYVDEALIREKEGETKVKVYVSNNASGRETLLAIQDTLRELKDLDTEGLFGRLALQIDSMNEEDWANNWKQYFHPIKIGKRLLIKPEWEELSDTEGRIVFDVNPGMTFGTGSHFTTQLCLEELEKAVVPGARILDLGCGSGILSIIALMLGADSATAVDIDPNAVDIAYQNAARNGVDASKYHVFSGNILTDSEVKSKIGEMAYDVVVANIVADVIIAMAPMARKYIIDGGIFITSGIIDDRVQEVEAALKENGFKILSKKQKADWCALTARAVS